MAAPEPMMTLLHDETGHVLAAVSSGVRAPTVDDLTGGSHLSVRVPGQDPVRVTPGLLTASRVPVRGEVLEDPFSYQLVHDEPAWVGSPKPLSAAPVLGAPGAAVLSLWQVGDHLVEIRSVLDATGKALGTAPPGAGGGLVLVAGAPLVTAP